MCPAVKRTYDSSSRQKNARLTRARIVEQATELFVDQGYGATSIAEVARGAGVSAQTVYAAFGTKAALLGAAVEVALAGDDEPVAVFDREEGQAALHAPTPARAAAAFASATTSLLERAGGILAAADAAAQTDPDLQPMWLMGHRARYADMHRVATSFAEAGFLRAQVDVDRAADLLWVLASPDAYRSLTVIQGWTADRYRAWLEETVLDTVLDDP